MAPLLAASSLRLQRDDWADGLLAVLRDVRALSPTTARRYDVSTSADGDPGVHSGLAHEAGGSMGRDGAGVVPQLVTLQEEDGLEARRQRGLRSWRPGPAQGGVDG